MTIIMIECELCGNAESAKTVVIHDEPLELCDECAVAIESMVAPKSGTCPNCGAYPLRPDEWRSLYTMCKFCE